MSGMVAVDSVIKMGIKQLNVNLMKVFKFLKDSHIIRIEREKAVLSAGAVLIKHVAHYTEQMSIILTLHIPPHTRGCGSR